MERLKYPSGLYAEGIKYYMKNKAAQQLGKMGGLATSKKYGREHYLKLAENMNRKKKVKSTDEAIAR